MPNSQYGMKTVRKVRRLAEDIPSHSELARHTEPSQATISRWEKMGLIDTGPSPKYPKSTVEFADELYEEMPLSGVSGATGVPESTLERWAKKGWISTEKNWLSENAGQPLSVSPRKIVETYFASEERSYRDVAEMLPVSKPTVGKYVRKYRNGDLSGIDL